MIRRYNLELDSEGYVISMTFNKNGSYELDVSSLNLSRLNCYKLIEGVLVFDDEKLARIIAEEEQEASLPTWQERIDAQVLYTALLTDSLLEE